MLTLGFKGLKLLGRAHNPISDIFLWISFLNQPLWLPSLFFTGKKS